MHVCVYVCIIDKIIELFCSWDFLLFLKVYNYILFDKRKEVENEWES